MLSLFYELQQDSTRTNRHGADTKDQTQQFYEILQTRINSFGELKKALNATSQFQALEILNSLKADIKFHSQIYYDRSQLLGSGCFGRSVYRGTYDNRKVAVKVLAFSRQFEKQRTIQQVDFLLRLDTHPNLAKYLKKEVVGKTMLLAQELISINLEDFVLHSTSADIFEVDKVSLLKQTVDGIGFLHTREIMHGNLKPSNILIDWQGQGKASVKIADFGLTRMVPEGMGSLSIHTAAFGTEGWASPEVYRRFIQHVKARPGHYLVFAVSILQFLFFYILQLILNI